MILAIDLGTSRCKGLAVRKDGKIEAETSQSYDQSFDPGSWRKAIKNTLSDIAENKDFRVEAIAVTGLGGAFFTLDENGEPVSEPFPAYLRSRDDEFSEDVSDLEGGRWMMYHNLLWLRENQPKNFEKSEKVLDARDYAAYVLTGNIRRNSFGFPQEKIEELNNCFNLQKSIFPRTSTYKDSVGVLSEDLAEKLNFGEVPVFVCPWDEICGALGAGAIEEGSAYCMAGTTRIAGVCVNDGNREYLLDDKELHSRYEPTGLIHREVLEESRFQKFHQLDDKARETGLEVFKGELTFEDRFKQLDSVAEKTRAIYEADAEHVEKALQEAQEEDIYQLVIGGGAAKSTFWSQVIAGNIGEKIRKAQTEKLAALGAAVMAYSSIDIYSDLRDAAVEMVEISEKQF